MRSELNEAIERLKEVLEERAEESRLSIKIMELIELLIDRQEENEVLLTQRLGEILSDITAR